MANLLTKFQPTLSPFACVLLASRDYCDLFKFSEKYRFVNNFDLDTILVVILLLHLKMFHFAAMLLLEWLCMH